MSYKRQISIAFICAFIIFIIPAIMEYKSMFLSGECASQQGGDIQRCLGIVMFPDQTQASSFFALILVVFFIPLYFLKEAVYLAWRKFALWYLPIVLILIFLAGNGSSGFNPGVGLDRESLTFFFSGLFFFISLILILVKSLKLRGK